MKNGQEVKMVRFKRKGEFITRQLTDDGTKMLDLTISYYAKVKKSGSDDYIEVRLGNTAGSAEAKLREIEDNNKLISRGLIPHNYDPDKSLLELHGKWIKDKRRSGTKDISLISPDWIVKRVLKDLNLNTIDDLLKPTLGDRLEDYIERLETEPRDSIEIPDLPRFTIAQTCKLFNMSQPALHTTLRKLGIVMTREGWYGYITKEQAMLLANRRNRPYAICSINARFRHFKDFLSWLVKKKFITHLPPFPLTKSVDTDRRKIRNVLSWEECLELSQKVVEAGVDYKHYTAKTRSILYKVAFTTMVRRRALSLLKVSDIKFKDQRILISIRAETDKTKTPRCIDLPTILHAEFIEHIKDKSSDDLVFGDLVKYPITSFMPQDLKLIGKTYSTPDGDFDFHQFRHSGATHYIKNDVPLHVIQVMGGWKDLRMLIKVYSHIKGDDVYERINGVFSILNKH